MKKEYIEKIYAGWLAKIIGIRLGVPVEGWSHEKIMSVYGESEGYLADYPNFCPDDDSNGPLFFLRALEDSKKKEKMDSSDVSEALLNYAPYEHGFFWWGGYGISTEHTAYLNLRNKISSPQSGSKLQNGKVIAEQIGGQIFVDTWGLVAPGNPDLAAKLAKEASSVTHDGNGVYGGMFIASCISHAFEEKDIIKIIEMGLSYIPKDSDYYKMVKSIIEFYNNEVVNSKNSQNYSRNYKKCLKFIADNYFGPKYPGMCHIIPNSAIIILSLLYGEGDFSKTIQICNYCGFDTDCNVANVATIMGVRNGLEDIDYNKWRKPINDILLNSSVVGSLNIMDIPYCASYIVKLAFELANKEIDEEYNEIINNKIDSCHFEYKGSTHGIRVRVNSPGANYEIKKQTTLINTDESAATGSRSLKVVTRAMLPGENIYIHKKTYYEPKDFSDRRYDPEFSPVVYPGQTVNGSFYIPSYNKEAKVCMYAKDLRSNIIYKGEAVYVEKEKWVELKLDIPESQDSLIEEIGYLVQMQGNNFEQIDFVALIDDLYVSKNPNYQIDFSKEKLEFWTVLHKSISQFTRFKGLLYLEENHLHLSCCDFGECYTGGYNWTNYSTNFNITPIVGQRHMVNVRVQGAQRSYAVGLLENSKLAILKKNGEYSILESIDYNWEHNKEYSIDVKVENNIIIAKINDEIILKANDNKNPYLRGSIGLSVDKGSHLKCRNITIK